MLIPLLMALTVGAATTGVLVYRSVARDQMRTVDTEVERALTASIGRVPDLERRPRVDGTEPEAFESPIRYVVDPGLDVITRLSGPDGVISNAELMRLVSDGRATTFEGDRRYRANSRELADGRRLVVALPLATVDESLASLRRNLLVLGALLVAIQALAVVLVARQVATPVRRLSGVAHRIAGGEFDADVGRPAGPRETAALTADLAAMVARLVDEVRRRERAAADAEQARADMERFMGDASHELRTPLTALRGYSDLYAAGMLDADGLDRAMARIGDESVRLSALVRDLLQLAQPSDRMRSEPVDVAAVASAVVQDLRAAHPTHPIGLDITDGDDCVVQGDAARLHQAILNLGANACQHTPRGTDVVVRVARRAASTVVEVIDRGPDVDPILAQTILQPFARGEASRSRSNHDGAGLGLALADRIVDQHGGAITIGSTPGGGATFTISLGVADL